MPASKLSLGYSTRAASGEGDGERSEQLVKESYDDDRDNKKKMVRTDVLGLRSLLDGSIVISGVEGLKIERLLGPRGPEANAVRVAMNVNEAL